MWLISTSRSALLLVLALANTSFVLQASAVKQSDKAIAQGKIAERKPVSKEEEGKPVEQAVVQSEPLRAPEPTYVPPLGEYETTFADLDDWTTVNDTVMTNSAGLAISAKGQTELQRRATQPFQVTLRFLKNNRFSDLLLPGGYFVRFGGRPDKGGGVVHKYGTNVSLHKINATNEGDEVEQLQLVGSTDYVVNQEQVLTVQVLTDQIRVYLQRETDGKYLHADTAWRAQPGPAIVEDVTSPIWEPETTKEGSTKATPSLLGIRSFESPTKDGLHHFHEFHATDVQEFADEAFFAVAEPVPSLADDGLQLPVIEAPWTHAGLAFRGDGKHIPDQAMKSLVSFVPFGTPPGEDGLGYIAATVWTQDSWNAWESYCRSNSIDPATGKLGKLSTEPGGVPAAFAGGSEVGVVNLASPDVRAFLKERAKALAAQDYVGIFFDVTVRFDRTTIGFNLPFTKTEWADLQGSLYREIWKDVLSPVGKWPMINGGNAKKDRNARLMHWIPILYQDRQINGDGLAADWSWHEQTVLINPRYRQGEFKDEWISVLDSIGGDDVCLNEDIKYGWLTTYYQSLATIGGFSGRHFLGGGFNGDWKAGGRSGRTEWRSRHFVPAVEYDIGQPSSAVTIEEEITVAIDGKDYRNKLYKASFQNAAAESVDVYHFPNYRSDDYNCPGLGEAPPYVLNFKEPHDVLQFDGTWAAEQMSVTIPAGSGRIVRASLGPT